MRTMVLLLSIDFVTGCASANSASTVSGDIGSDEVIEMIVQNRIDSPITAFALWEGGGSVTLGQISAGASSTFAAEYRGPGVVLWVDVLSGFRLLPGRPEAFVQVRPGDRVKWFVSRQSDGVGEDYIRLPPK